MGVAPLIEAYRSAPESSARVLLTTIFGDALLPRSQKIGVQQLAELVAPFGISDRLVRTSLLRLNREHLVVSEKQGRRSYYCVAPDALSTFAQAEIRIYQRTSSDWDGEWTMAVLDPNPLDAESNISLRDELRWLGVAAISPGVFLSPHVPTAAIAEAAKRVNGSLAVLTRAPAGAIATIGDGRLALLTMPLTDLRAGYERHLERFSGVRPPTTPSEAFAVRSLLIDSWRRLVLRDPDLPTELLLDTWPATRAFERTAALYREAHGLAEAHLDELLGASEAVARTRF